MTFQVEYRTIWEYGMRKDFDGNPHQEDSIYPEYRSQDESARLFIVCDGMGGHDAGEIASYVVCNSLREYISDASDEAFNISKLNEALAVAYKELDCHDNGSVKKMGTTLALLKLHSQGALIAHIGDSRVYHIRPGVDGNSTVILSKTEDHSLVNELIKIGELTPEEAKTSKSRNVITRAMQPNTERCNPDVYQTSDVLPGDYFYLCSDGMLEQMEDDAIRNIFSNAGGNIDDKTKILKGATSENKDNHSAIIVCIRNVSDDKPYKKAPIDNADCNEKSMSNMRTGVNWKKFFKF